MGPYTLIVEGPGDAMTLVPIEADITEELFRIGREMFPGRRLAAVNHEDENEDWVVVSAKCRHRPSAGVPRSRTVGRKVVPAQSF
jgi:hypothetical protein